MAFDIQGPGKRFAIEREDDPLLSLPDDLDVTVSLFSRIKTYFYSSFAISGEGLRRAESQLSGLQTAYRDHLRVKLSRERGIRAKDPEVVNRALAPLMSADPTLARIDALLDCCRDALKVGDSLQCDGD